eukprot:1642572-Alexandrium_andersonii.AAC.1
MSASLVGSEMCIRDRVKAERAGFPPNDPEALQRDRVQGSPPRRCRPVSYTRLTLPTICSV